MIFSFNEQIIETALRANGWNDLWHPNNWVHESATNPDWAGVSKKEAFETLLRKSNLISRNVDKFWS
jgi:hypothetical protein